MVGTFGFDLDPIAGGFFEVDGLATCFPASIHRKQWDQGRGTELLNPS